MNDLAPTNRPVLVLVDDDDALGDSVKFAMEFEGFEVRTFDSAEALLADAMPPSNACLVVDVNLPAMNGVQLLRLLREREDATPAILMTTNPTRRLRSQAQALGVPIVEKPLLTDALLLAVNGAMASR